MHVNTTEAAKLLGISSRRLLDLLQKRRVIGAYKSGRFWIIPLHNGLPQVIPGKRGRRGTWKTKKAPKITIVHINKNHIQQNFSRTATTRKPVIAIKTSNSGKVSCAGRGSKGNINVYARGLDIPYPCRLVYQPDNPLDCGAKVWIEVLGDDLIARQPPANIIPYSLIK